MAVVLVGTGTAVGLGPRLMKTTITSTTTTTAMIMVQFRLIYPSEVSGSPMEAILKTLDFHATRLR
jgi:hypothetical protein